MTENTNVVEVPPINPEKTAKELALLSDKLDKLPSDVTSRQLLDFLQDQMLPAVRTMHTEVMAALFYINMHEDRLDLVEQGEGVLDPEEARHILDYVSESLEVLKKLAADAKVPGLTDLIKQGEECVPILQDFCEEEEPAADPGHRERH